ncbi:MAG: hypothetical protein J7515_13420 [Caulobacter sp.]|nr:hypothetical protein [Caulobacter sp.]
MPRSRTKARLRAARWAAEGRVEGQGEDAGRTAAHLDYMRREIRRRLGVKVGRAARSGEARTDEG